MIGCILALEMESSVAEPGIRTLKEEPLKIDTLLRVPQPAKISEIEWGDANIATV